MANALFHAGHIRAEWALLRARQGNLDGAQDIIARASGCRSGAMQMIDAQLDLSAYRELFPTEQRRIEPLVARALLLADLPGNAADTAVMPRCHSMKRKGPVPIGRAFAGLLR